ncbi:MAG: thiamine diphosphokinase [Chloroflexota bacterium]|nr:thiamine diphosphokinase [Chloroflexota bacterium]
MGDALRPSGKGRKAIIVGNGRVPVADALPPGTLEGAGFVIAADGGALQAIRIGLRPDVAVGDGDSLAPGDLALLAEMGIPFRHVPAEKDESDLELAVRLALASGAAEVVILAALEGPRIEHSLASLSLLALPELAGRPASLVDERSTIRLLTAEAANGRLTLSGETGDYVSLLPWGGDVEGVTTEALRYPLIDEPLTVGPSRGLSNELTTAKATVRLRRGRLLVVHTRRASLREPLLPAPGAEDTTGTTDAPGETLAPTRAGRERS